MRSHLMNRKDMAQSCRVSTTVFDKWGMTPVGRKSREAFYDVASVVDDRVNNAINRVVDDKGEVDDDELLRVRIRLPAAQVETQELKNERERGDIVDTTFCIYVLSKLASQIFSIMDSLPLAMTRKFLDMKPFILDRLKKEVVGACNACIKLDENIPLMLFDYLMGTAGNAPDKLQPSKDK